MNKQNRNIFRLIIFIIGLVIILAAPFVILFGTPAKYLVNLIDTSRIIFVWISIIILYIGLFLPAVLPLKNKRDSGGLFVGTAFYYKGFIVYAVLSFIIMKLALNVMIPLAIVILAQAVAVFAWLIFIYFACHTTSHINEVAEREEVMLSQINRIRQELANLQIRASALPIEKKVLKDKIERLNEDFRYISPSNDQRAVMIEKNILNAINAVSHSAVFQGGNDMGDERLMRQLDEISMLYQQRKSIY